MIRLVLAVALTVAVAGVAFPAVERGRVDRTATDLEGDADRLARSARLLADRNDPTDRDVPGASRRVVLDFPTRSLAAAGVARFAVESAGDTTVGGWVRYRVAGGSSGRVRVPVPVETPDGPVVLERGGRHALRLRLIDESDPAVLVERAGGG